METVLKESILLQLRTCATVKLLFLRSYMLILALSFYRLYIFHLQCSNVLNMYT